MPSPYEQIFRVSALHVAGVNATSLEKNDSLGLTECETIEAALNPEP